MQEQPLILVTGGAGYIGSQMVLELQSAGYTPVVVDNFKRGSLDTVHRLQVPFFQGDLRDSFFIKELLQKHRPAAVMHFAALAYVGESVETPSLYYDNNVCGTLSLLGAMVETGVDKIIFSSTCATYGVPVRVPIDESNPQQPINPYGRTKLMIEQILADYRCAYGLKSISFRYFNAAGADPAVRIGERHDPETHIIPLALAAAARGGEFKVFGNDYDTPDGTCIRDYIHVSDIAQAHILGLKRLLAGGEPDAYNIGTGQGYSVMEVLGAVERVSGRSVSRVVVPRRAGDPPELVAAPGKIQRELGWSPKHSDIEAIVRTAWRWHSLDWGL